jgi:uncharacterized protein (DUF58 family)
MVREFEEDTGRNLILVFDPWEPDPSRHRTAFEAAVSLTATIIWEWTRQSSEYLMLAVAGPSPNLIAGCCSRDQALAMLRQLAEVQPTSSTDPTPLLRAVAREVVPVAPVVVVSARRKSPLVESLAASWNRPVAHISPHEASVFYDAPGTFRDLALHAGEGEPCPS